MLTHALTQAGRQVEVARGGAEALEFLREDSCRLVISNWEMPGIDGPNAAGGFARRSSRAISMSCCSRHATTRTALSRASRRGRTTFSRSPFAPASFASVSAPPSASCRSKPVMWPFSRWPNRLNPAIRKPRRKPQRKPTSDVIAEVCSGQPDITELVQKVASRFENRTFLPQLRDVERFLDRAGVAHGRLRSRRASTELVIKTLAGFAREELEHLAQPPEGHGDSDYAVLAREIMGDRRAKHSGPAKKGDGQ